MYSAIWKKYLSVIRILIKRTVNENQSLQLNASDFEKKGPLKKTGFNFVLTFTNGRVDDLASLSNPAKELSDVLLQEPQIKELLMRGEYQISMNSKFVMGIKLVPAPETVTNQVEEAVV